MNIQVDKQHYQFLQYVNISRWDSYYYQIREVLRMEPNTVLVVGVGDKIVVDILRSLNIVTYTLDFDPELKPDFCGSISDLDTLVGNFKIDTIVCCQVLEHLPYELFAPTLKAMSHHCKNIVMSLPYANLQILKLSIKLERIKKRTLDIKIPLFWKACNVNGSNSEGHYWEIGRKQYSISKIKKDIQQYFEIKETFFPPENNYHFFLELKNKSF